MKEETVSSEQVYTGRIVRLRVDEVRLVPAGRLARREVVEHPGAVAIVPVTPDGHVLLVRQYRYAAGEELLEIPAGTLEPGEDPTDCAVRELAEETGHRATRVELLTSVFMSPGFCNELIHIYLARLEGMAGGPRDPDEDEQLEVVRLPLARALDLARSGQLRDAKSVVGLCLAAARA